MAIKYINGVIIHCLSSPFEGGLGDVFQLSRLKPHLCSSFEGGLEDTIQPFRLKHPPTPFKGGVGEFTLSHVTPVWNRFRIVLLLLVLTLGTGLGLMAQAPYQGGEGDGYAMTTATANIVGSAEISPNEQLLSLFPNPVRQGQNAHLEIAGWGSGNLEWRIWDMNGKGIKQGIAKIKNGGQKLELSFSDLPQGSYLLEINKDDFREALKLRIVAE